MKNCQMCIYLYVIDNTLKSEVVPSLDCRKTGIHFNSHKKAANANFICSLGQPEFQCKPVVPARDMHSQDHDKVNRENVALLERENNCSKFVKWTPGKSPREIEEMSIAQSVFELQQKLFDWRKEQFDWRKEQAESNRKLSEKIQALEETRHQENLDIARTATKSQMVVAYVGIAVTAVISIASLVVSIIGLFKN